MKYEPQRIEEKWQQAWDKCNAYHAANDPKRPKKYILDMFPYPSGDGLHVGHVKIYTASDIISRFYRAKGFNVLHPMGWDAFGLPAENYAIKTGTHPRVITQRNISNIKQQMQRLGFSYDWKREIDTTNPEYYRWTQWIFLKLLEHGLAYEDTVPINWCPKDKTGLANEEVVNGLCDRCGTAVEKKEIRQWILRITKYADRLVDDLNGLDWPEFIKEMQRNWIGRSTGSSVKFALSGSSNEIEVYTTRVETLFGVTAIVIAPEYDGLIDIFTADKQDEVKAYQDVVKNKSDLERSQLNKDKTGVFTGCYALHPLTGEEIPVWVADYVLGHYGTGAVMLVPGHDERDHEFAVKYGLTSKKVISNESQKLIDSREFSGMNVEEARIAITAVLEKKQRGKPQVQYKLRDWIFSRQRYWGEPIPVVHCNLCGIVPVPEDQLPVQLPEVERYEPTGTGDSPLAGIDEWVNTTCPKCGGEAKRETNTMPQWAGSCWYYLRFCDTQNQECLVGREAEQYWLPVDWYLGGAEHAVLHLLYARFWHKFLFDIGIVSTVEPFYRLSSVGLVLAADGKKMSKSKGNVINPNEIIDDYGADTLRMYEAFMGPFENTIAWDPNSINGVHRFLIRAWDKLMNEQSTDHANEDTEIVLNQLIEKVENDIEEIKLNTAIAAMMKFLNTVENKPLTREQKSKLLIVLGVFAPHLAEEIWHELGHTDHIIDQAWPLLANVDVNQQLIELPVQINGKMRGVVLTYAGASESEILVQIKEIKSISRHLDEKSVKKVVFVPGKIINLVVE